MFFPAYRIARVLPSQTDIFVKFNLGFHFSDNSSETIFFVAHQTTISHTNAYLLFSCSSRGLFELSGIKLLVHVSFAQISLKTKEGSRAKQKKKTKERI